MIKNNKGFTLIEVLVSMSIFVVFMSVLISSYTSIITAQREANDYRIMYAEARAVFESVIAEFREGMIDYPVMQDRGNLLGSQSDVWLVGKDAITKAHIFNEDGILMLEKGAVIDSVGVQFTGDQKNIELNEVEKARIKDFRIYVTPSVDPYAAENVSLDLQQFHPKVTIVIRFEKELSNGKIYNLDLQTSLSSRIYNQIYAEPQVEGEDLFNFGL